MHEGHGTDSGKEWNYAPGQPPPLGRIPPVAAIGQNVAGNILKMALTCTPDPIRPTYYGKEGSHDLGNLSGGGSRSVHRTDG